MPSAKLMGSAQVTGGASCQGYFLRTYHSSGEIGKKEYLNFAPYPALLFATLGFMIFSYLSSSFSLDPCPTMWGHDHPFWQTERQTHLPLPLTCKPHGKKSKSHGKQWRETQPPRPSLLSTYVSAQILHTFRATENNMFFVYSIQSRCIGLITPKRDMKTQSQNNLKSNAVVAEQTINTSVGYDYVGEDGEEKACKLVQKLNSTSSKHSLTQNVCLFERDWEELICLSHTLVSVNDLVIFGLLGVS